MGVKSRLYEYIKAKHLTVKGFEQSCNLSNGYVSSIKEGIGTKKLEIILERYPDLDRNWLLFGEGNMFGGNVVREPDFAGYANAALQKTINLLAETNSRLVDDNLRLCEELKKVKSENELLKKGLGAQEQAG